MDWVGNPLRLWWPLMTTLLTCWEN